MGINKRRVYQNYSLKCALSLCELNYVDTSPFDCVTVFSWKCHDGGNIAIIKFSIVFSVDDLFSHKNHKFIPMEYFISCSIIMNSSAFCQIAKKSSYSKNQQNHRFFSIFFTSINFVYLTSIKI